MAAKKPQEREPDRLKVEGDWKDAARKLLATLPKSAPPRVVKKRKTGK
jgi:hypothetical protein